MRLFQKIALSLAFICAGSSVSISQYTLTVESSTPVVAPGTVYRIYVDLINTTDRMSAVFGNNNDLLEVNAPAGVFNSTYNASWSASGINPAFLPIFPELADDSYATIGLDGPASSSLILDAADPSLVEDSAQPLTPFFVTDGSTLLQANTLTGASYYVLNTAGNGLPDVNLRVLIMQVTTTGTIDGTISFQVFPLGVGANQIQSTITFSGIGTFTQGVVDVPGCMVSTACNYDPLATIDDGSCDFVSCLAFGCTDTLACNYDSLAQFDDGTCIYALFPYDCFGVCVNDINNNGVCDELEVYGCMDPLSSNYDPNATIDNGLCVTALCSADLDPPFWAYFPDSTIISCDILMPPASVDMPIAGDFCSPTADIVITSVDGPFEYPFGCLQSYNCPRLFTATDTSGNSISQIQWFTVLDTSPPVFALPTLTAITIDQTAFETIPIAEAYVIDACDINAGWSYLDVIITDVPGSQIIERTYTTVDGCGNTAVFVQTITVITTIYGCTDPLACNYDILVETDDGSCVYPGLGEDCLGNCIVDTDGDGICDLAEIPGCDDPNACNYDVIATDNDGSCDYCSCTTAGTAGYGLAVEVVAVHTTGALAGLTTYRIYITTPHTDDFLSAIFGDDFDPLNISSTTTFYQNPLGSVLGSSMNPAFYAAFPDLEFDSWVTIGLDGPAGTGESAPQLIESTNFSWVTQFEAGGDLIINDSVGGSWFVLDPQNTSNANPDINSRILVAQLTTDGTPSGLIHAQMFNHGSQSDVSRIDLSFNGITGTVPLTCGCTDILACNYLSTYDYDDGSCIYEQVGYDCNGVCLVDTDGDGVCDPFELWGCTDPLACNYAALYTEEDGSCFYGIQFYDCAGNCINDSDGDGVCDELEVFGCTDPLACNFNVNATEDDGACGGDQINDFCSGALPISCGSSVVANNVDCVAIDDVPGCAASQPILPSGGLWYTFDGTGEEVTLTTCSPLTTFDTYMSVYAGTCNALVCKAGNDDQSEPLYDNLCGVNAFASTIVFTPQLGVTYLVLVNGSFGETGTFELSLSCVISGCTDIDACNYDSMATIEDGSCEYLSCLGCMDVIACNYDITASIDDLSCEYLTCAGCMDILACNYDSAITIADDSCTYPVEFYDCSDICLNDSDSDGVCDELEVVGCTDINASNFDAFATEEDGSCVYCDLIVSATITSSIICNGDTTAALEISVLNAINAILFYTVNDSTYNQPIIEGLPAGLYTITVSDGPICAATTNIEITEPEAFSLTLETTDITCEGSGDGTISFIASGGTGSLTYFINGIESISSVFTNLAAGDYDGYVIDGSGCASEVITVTIADTTPIELTIITEDVLCNGGSTGSFSASAIGGAGNYTYSFSGNEFTIISSYSGLSAGIYSLQVQDANGCIITAAFEIIQPDPIIISNVTVENSITDLSNGTINIDVSGGVPGYTYYWTDDIGEFMGDTEDLSSIAGGLYTLIVTDINGCTVALLDVLVDEVDSVFEINQFAFEMYPNPAYDFVRIELNQIVSDATLIISDATGRQIMSKRIDQLQGSLTLEISDWAPGIYQVRLNTKAGIGVKPLLIQR